MKIIICGAGPGGLTCAHQLSKIPGVEIVMYEKLPEIGGLARSGRDNFGCATEYCWRVYFGFYDNLFRIFDEIPVAGSDSGSRTVHQNLVQYRHQNIIDNDISVADKARIFWTIAGGMTSCDARLSEMDNLAWWDSLGKTPNNNLFREIGGWLGMDRMKGSFNSVIKVGMEMQMFPALFDAKYHDYVMNAPTSEAWFDHWQAHLEARGVKINLNCNLIQIEHENDITGILIEKRNTLGSARSTEIIREQADVYVFALPCQVLATLMPERPSLTKLAENLHTQVAFQVYFDRKISLGPGGATRSPKTPERESGNNAFLLVDSPWDLIVLQYDQIYGGGSGAGRAAKIDTPRKGDRAGPPAPLCTKIPAAKGGWSVAICTAYIPGIVTGKTFLECTFDEIIEELWAQLSSSQKLRNLVSEFNDNLEFSRNLIVHWSPMWPTFERGDQTGAAIWHTSEPKFTNNVGTLALRPSFRTQYQNAYIATAYIHETIDIFSMEAAAIAGCKVAHEIAQIHLNSTILNNQNGTIRPRPWQLAPFRAIDSVFYMAGLPNMVIVIIIIAIVGFLGLYITKKLQQQGTAKSR